MKLRITPHVARVQKLLRLAKATTCKPEAESARRKATYLASQHHISLGELKRNDLPKLIVCVFTYNGRFRRRLVTNTAAFERDLKRSVMRSRHERDAAGAGPMFLEFTTRIRQIAREARMTGRPIVVAHTPSMAVAWNSIYRESDLIAYPDGLICVRGVARDCHQKFFSETRLAEYLAGVRADCIAAANHVSQSRLRREGAKLSTRRGRYGVHISSDAAKVQALYEICAPNGGAPMSMTTREDGVFLVGHDPLPLLLESGLSQKDRPAGNNPLENQNPQK